MTTQELISRIGPALYGRNWQTELAETMQLNKRTVQRWIAGTAEPRLGVWQVFDDLLAARAAEVQEVRSLIRDYAQTQAEAVRN